MVLRVVSVGEAVLLGASGALMYAASWQRWGGACPWGGRTSAACEIRQDHRYDFVAPSAPWVPVGSAAQLAGWSLLVLAVAYVLLPWVLTGRRPGPVVAVVLAGAVLGSGAAGLTTLRSGLVGRPVDPPAGVVPGLLWLFLPPVVLVSLAVSARGWGLVAAVSLFLATPIVCSFTYAIGSYDANPWWEAISAAFVALAGLCVDDARTLVVSDARKVNGVRAA